MAIHRKRFRIEEVQYGATPMPDMPSGDISQ
jgi:hypothetical protein